jgi:hypothetical protein
MDPTKNYIEEHKYVFSLPRKSLNPRLKKRKAIGWSLKRLVRNHIFSALRCFKNYPKEIWEGRNYLPKTARIRNCKKGKTAIVIGNGPSQGYLSVDVLNKFVEHGGETYCVNYWPTNQKLSSHVPTWMVFSDPDTFKASEKARSLVEYLKKNNSIKIVVPSSLISELNFYSLNNDFYIFVDSEFTLWRNINPLYPRGYTSMTLYKALAWAIHLGYGRIGVIGMDNTYPRNIFNDEMNRVCNLETHAGEPDSLLDMSPLYENVAALLDDLFKLFYDLSLFEEKNIFNLDIYSLTDAFEKVSILDFLEGVRKVD